MVRHDRRHHARRPAVARPADRSYPAVVRRLVDTVPALPGARLLHLGDAVHGGQPYPLFELRLTVGPRSSARRPMRVCLGAGIHGDEPAGVEGTLRWLEALPAVRSRLPAAELTIFPCLNPSGYVHGRRENDDGIDLNRQYKNPRAPVEVRLVRRSLRGRRFDLSVEFHEDVDSTGFYLYEVIDGARPIGPRLIDLARRMLPINEARVIEGAPASAGVIDRGRAVILRRRTRWPHALYLFHLGTPHCLTFETPVTAPLHRRAGLHADLLTLALRHCARG